VLPLLGKKPRCARAAMIVCVYREEGVDRSSGTAARYPRTGSGLGTHKPSQSTGQSKRSSNCCVCLGEVCQLRFLPYVSHLFSELRPPIP
jgi:hypothetical protein